MATKKAPAKKAPAKKAAAKKTSNDKWDGVKLPEGFRAITSGDYGDEWEFEKKPTLTGQVQGDVREVETGAGRNKRTSRVITVLDEDDGKSYTVWESAALKGFFDEVQKGFRVSIAFHGYRDVGRPQPMKVFEGAISEEDLEALDDAPPTRKKPAAEKKTRKSAASDL